MLDDYADLRELYFAQRREESAACGAKFLVNPPLSSDQRDEVTAFLKASGRAPGRCVVVSATLAARVAHAIRHAR